MRQVTIFQTHEQTTDTHCPYCAFQCGMHLTNMHGELEISGNPSFPVNKGGLCLKGWTASTLLKHPDRLLNPLVRSSDDTWTPLSWPDTLKQIANKIQALQEKYGPHAIGVFGGGGLTNEKAYLLGKFARVALGTMHIDYNGRFCMSSAAAASMNALGIDRGLPFPLEDIPFAEVIILVGSNLAETMPPIRQYFEAQRQRGGICIVIDPRTSVTAQAATIHLPITPGTDMVLAHGILHILIHEGLIDEEYIETRTDGFTQLKANVSSYWPERVERITGIAEKQLFEVARLFGKAKTAIILTARGLEQQSRGVQNTLAFINLALTTGRIGRPYSGYGCLTGQGNGQGGREHGQKADQLPGYRKIDDPVARQHIAKIWEVEESSLPGPGVSAYEMLMKIGEADGIRALLVFGSNITVSAPNVLEIERKLAQLDLLVVGDFFLSETASKANFVLPVTQWAEEEGTMTNLEGRVILRKQAIAPPANVRNEIEILCELARLLGKQRYFHFPSSRAVFDELRRASAGGLADYAGITYEKIEAQQGIFWPCPTIEHPGTPRLFQDHFPTPNGRAYLSSNHYQGPGEEPDEAYPLYLTTGRLLAHYQSGTQTRRVKKLQETSAEPFAELHPTTAQAYCVADNDLIRLTTRRGQVLFKAKLTRNIREDTIFIPFHWGGNQSANRLTNPELDPISRMPEFKVCAVRIELAIEGQEEQR